MILFHRLDLGGRVRSWRRLPAGLAVAIDACLEPEPASRPTTAELTDALEPLADRA